jgi:predicted Zn-dependent protease
MRLTPAAAVAALATVALLPAQEQSSFRFTKVDLKLLEEYEALDQKYENCALVYHDADLEKHLADLAAPLLPRAPLERVKWQFRILRDPMVNAHASPNGSVYLNTGLLARAENDDQVAGVLAHEVTHVVRRDTYIFNRSQRKKAVASEIISVAAAWIPAGNWGVAVAVAAAANVSPLVILDLEYGYSREIEEEADRIGLERLKGAGRDPAQLVRMFEILDDKLEPEPVPRFFLDHPRTKDRIVYLKEAIGLDRDVPARDDPGYADRMRPAILQNIQLDLDSRRFRSAVAAAERLAAAHPEDPVALYWLGESYRALGPREPRLTQEQASDGALRKGYKQTEKRTEAEDDKALAATPEGRKALEANQRKAEEFLRQAASLDASLSGPYFGLGALYQQQGKKEQAVEAYKKCIELSKRPGEKGLAQRRLEGLTKGPQGGGK